MAMLNIKYNRHILASPYWDRLIVLYTGFGEDTQRKVKTFGPRWSREVTTEVVITQLTM